MYRRLAASETAVFASNIPSDASLPWKVACSLLHVIAVSSSAYRLWERFGLHRAWWDDYVLFLPLVLNIFFATSLWITIPHKSAIPKRKSPMHASY
ncbi:hypothetical protein BJ912DRAFT_149515 [Pholiota molesta]|nr:hypothetical protein BJ912DRAFT_159008 [Pholiota molesta]KAF8170367.1 hypothetical protein BJ912DRAFT_149515 [Pholiota molesta]